MNVINVEIVAMLCLWIFIPCSCICEYFYIATLLPSSTDDDIKNSFATTKKKFSLLCNFVSLFMVLSRMCIY